MCSRPALHYVDDVSAHLVQSNLHSCCCMSTKGFASSFADLADVRAFKRAKAKGMTDQEAFRYGDNGIGFVSVMMSLR